MNDIPRPWTDPDLARRLSKPRPKLLEKQDRESARDKKDRLESAKVRARSGGQCEVYEKVPGMRVWKRCMRRAAPGNHHLIGGSGRRNRGRSILAECRIDTCLDCHRDITNHVLVPEDGTKKEDAATVRYERVR